MSDPTHGGGAARKSKRQAMRDAHFGVQETNEQLGAAREVYGPSHPTVKKLVGDSTEAVKKRSKAVKDYQFARELGTEE